MVNLGQFYVWRHRLTGIGIGCHRYGRKSSKWIFPTKSLIRAQTFTLYSAQSAEQAETYASKNSCLDISFNIYLSQLVGRKTWFSRYSGSFWPILSVPKIMLLVPENKKRFQVFFLNEHSKVAQKYCFPMRKFFYGYSQNTTGLSHCPKSTSCNVPFFFTS